jgi:hypothetical protein
VTDVSLPTLLIKASSSADATLPTVLIKAPIRRENGGTKEMSGCIHISY